MAFQIKRAHLRTLHVSRGCVRRFGLTPARYDMLYALLTGQASRQRDLWRLFDVSRATVSRMLIALERLGLVHRIRTRGLPSRFVELTKEGTRLMTEAVRGCHRPMIRLFESLFPYRKPPKERVLDVAYLEEWVRSVGWFFGNHARFHYPYGHPDN